jgi:two-component system sensor histidine kinase KdpD
VHPSEIFEAARGQIEHALGQRTLDVSVESEALVRVDPRLTSAALAHLLENAAQYTPQESSISVSLTVSDHGLVAQVRDRGPGIASKDLAHLFERFYRGDEAKQRVSGTGMGLSIARGLLMAEQGRIWAENRDDGGAQFTIEVPAESRAADVCESGP